MRLEGDDSFWKQPALVRYYVMTDLLKKDGRIRGIEKGLTSHLVARAYH
jgi:hypothetical protein